MTEHTTIYALLCFMVVRECFYIYSSNKLLDKLMSRNYNEYEWTRNLKKTLEPQTPKQEPEDVPEDLSIMNGFGMN